MSRRTCPLHLSFQQLCMCRTQTVSHTCSKLSVHRKLQHLSKQGGHTEQIGSSLSSTIRSIRLWCSACALPLMHDVHHGFNGMCVSTRVSFSQTRKAHKVWGLAPLLPRQELCHRRLDPQQLVVPLRSHAWKNHLNLTNFAILQLAHMSSVNLMLARTTFVNFVNHQLVHVTFRTHDLRDPSSCITASTAPLTW